MFEKFDVGLIYENTLHFSKPLRPWAFDAQGQYLGLDLRYRFVLKYLKDRKNFNFKDSEYYEFLKKAESESGMGLYEGNASWRYIKPKLICIRFINLIQEVEKNPEDDTLVKFFEKKQQNYIKVFMLAVKRVLFEVNNPVYVRYNCNHKIVKKPESSLRNQIRLVSKIFKRNFSPDMGLFPIAYKNENKVVLGNGCHRLSILKALSVLENKPLKLICCWG